MIFIKIYICFFGIIGIHSVHIIQNDIDIGDYGIWKSRKLISLDSPVGIIFDKKDGF